MKSFFEEYGFVILAAIVVILLIAMATPIGDLVKIQVSEVVNSFGSKTQSKLNATDGIINVRASTTNNKITLEWDAIKKEDKFRYQYKASNTSKDADWTPITEVSTGSDKSRKVEITTDSSGVDLTNKTKVEYKIYDSNDQLVASGIVIAKISKNIGDGSGGTVEEGISKTDSFVGYYADVDGNGTVDGIIFADLAVGGSGTWNPSGESRANSTGTYSYGTIPTDELKDYVILEGKYSGKFGEKPIVKAVGNGKDRFYVMALKNVDSTIHPWYYKAGKMGNYKDVTSPNFGSGKKNTATMIREWNINAYGGHPPHYLGRKDVWYVVQNKGRWFVPSAKEWAVFAGNLGITKDNWRSKGLSAEYYTSSQNSNDSVYRADFSYGYMDWIFVDYSAHVRLATTF